MSSQLLVSVVHGQKYPQLDQCKLTTWVHSFLQLGLISTRWWALQAKSSSLFVLAQTQGNKEGLGTRLMFVHHKGASPNYFFQNNVIKLEPHPPHNVTSLISSKIIIRRRSLLLLTDHYPCVCCNTARWTAHTELLDDHKLYLLSPKHGAKQYHLYVPNNLLADKTSRG